ncbi:438_t:CDS:2, partial [Dentiscutata erythropus]
PSKFFSIFFKIIMSIVPTDWRLLLSEDERKANISRLYKGLELLNQPQIYKFNQPQVAQQQSQQAQTLLPQQLPNSQSQQLQQKISMQILQQQQQPITSPQQQHAQTQRILLQQQLAQQQSLQAQTLLLQQLPNSQSQQLQQKIPIQILQQQQQPIPSPQQQYAQTQRTLLQQQLAQQQSHQALSLLLQQLPNSQSQQLQQKIPIQILQQQQRPALAVVQQQPQKQQTQKNAASLHQLQVGQQQSQQAQALLPQQLPNSQSQQLKQQISIQTLQQQQQPVPFPQQQQQVQIQRLPIQQPHLLLTTMPFINNSKTQPGSLTTLTEKEEKEALTMIRQIDNRAKERKKIQYHEVDLSEEDKRQIWIKLCEFAPIYEKIDEILPYVWHYTKSSQDTYRLLGMKYIIEDQLNALSSGKYILKLNLVENLLQQIRKYFVFVDSRRRDIVVPPQQPQPGAESRFSPLIKSNSLDLKLPTMPRHVKDNSATSDSSSIPTKRYQPSVDQDVPQSNKKLQIDSNSVKCAADSTSVINQNNPIVVSDETKQNIPAEILPINTDNQNNPIVIPKDSRQNISAEISAPNIANQTSSTVIQESDKDVAVTEDYHAGSQLLMNQLNKLLCNGSTMAQRQTIEGYSPYEESENRAIIVSLINAA